MFRKLALTLGAVMAIGVGMAAAPAPAKADVRVGFSFGPSYGYHHRSPYYGYYAPRRHYYAPPPSRCERVVVRKKNRYGKWVKVVERRCYPRRGRYY